MRMFNFAQILVLLAILAAPAMAQDHVVQFSHPDRIRYDGQCISIEGKDTLIYSGAFHYFRCPKPLWRDRLAKIKEAGFNAVETYIAWNFHERNEPKDLNDFSNVDLTDLKDFLKMAQDEFGLYTIVRPGPYICAEWAGGGFPVWLLNKKPADTTRTPWLRSDDPAYLAWSKHWLDAVSKVIVDEQITRKPVGAKGIILYQIENEYDFFAGVPEVQRVAHLKSLYRDAVDSGIDVPIFTCWTRQIRGSTDEDLKNVFDAPNSYPRWGVESTGKDIDSQKKSQPYAPGAVTELQGGWFSQVGGQLSESQDGISAAQINAVTLTSLAHGGTLLNYYMLFGGTNLEYWGGRNITTTYDYACPIRESGGVGDKYLAVKAIGAMLHQIGPALARSKQVEVTPAVSSDVKFIVRESADGSRFIFCFNPSRTEAKQGEAQLKIAGDEPLTKVSYQLDPFGYKVLALGAQKRESSEGTWYPQPQPAIERPAVPRAITLTDAQIKDDSPADSKWTKVEPGKTLGSLGINDSRYVLYRAKLTLTQQQIDEHPTLQLILFNGDPVLIRVNGAFLPSELRARERLAAGIKDRLHAGENEIVLLYENRGYSHFGGTLGDIAGLVDGYLSKRAAESQLVHWRVKLCGGDETKELVDPDTDDRKWQSFDLTEKTIADMEKAAQPGAELTGDATARILFGKHATAVFRTSLEVTPEMMNAPIMLEFGRIDDDGTVYINGQEAGHTNDWRRRLKVDVVKFVKPGANSVAVIVNNRDAAGGLTRPVVILEGKSNAIDLPWELADNLGGINAGWTKADFNASDWKTETPNDKSSLFRWYRYEFTLPQSADAWIPWVAKINANGNGIVYLNGQNIGRYWQQGPQRDYFLPECWLKTGSDKNTLLIGLRRTDKDLTIQPVEIAPLAELAEVRKKQNQ